MDHVELVILGLLVAVAALGLVAQVTRIPYPILFVVGGGALGFVPGIPAVELDPEVVLLIFLPPLLYNGASLASVRELRSNMRTITLSAFGLVALTAATVAVVAHAAIDGLPWAAAFALGAIVAPTDPLAAVQILRRYGVPRRILAIIEGDSLINDGSALVLYRTAVTATTTGAFSVWHAGLEFVLSGVAGVAIGCAVAWALCRVLVLVSDPVLAVTVTLVGGYGAYLPAEEIGVSGVLAAVACGLWLGYQGPGLFAAQVRLRNDAFWEVLVFLMNALLFVLVGLQLPSILADQERSTAELLGLGGAIFATVFATRLLFLSTMPYVIRALDRRPQQVARRVPFRARLVSLFAAMRGVVSLAAALALPDGFPERDLLIFCTFCVIFATLVLQGLVLPAVIRFAGFTQDDGEAEEEQQARLAAVDAALGQLRELAREDWTRDDTVERMTNLYEFRQRRFTQRAEGRANPDDEDLDARSANYQRMVHEVIAAQRRAVIALRDARTISDDVLHRLQRELDLEEERLEL